MIRFNNDYNHAGHPALIKAIADCNANAYTGYGCDEVCDAAKEAIKKTIGRPDSDVHFVVGGTQGNFIMIASALRPIEGVVSPVSGHINVHETGAVENSGRKILQIPAKDGKITAQQVEAIAVDYENSDIKEHIVRPKMVYISYPTEFGTIYSKDELSALYAACKAHKLYLFIDGARMGYGIAAGDMTIQDIAANCDAFLIGGTKCGALFGEAVVINNDELKPDFRAYIKQNGAMLSKGFLLGVQFYTMFKDGLYFEITKSAISKAMRIKKVLQDKGIPFHIDSPTNQQFPIMENKKIEELLKDFDLEFEFKTDENHSCVRICTSWSTTDEEVDQLIAALQK